MKTNSLFVASRERHAGSLLVSLGIMSMLRQQYEKIAFYRPIVTQRDDADIKFINTTFKLNLSTSKMAGVTLTEAIVFLRNNNQHALFEKLVQQFHQLKQDYDFVLIQGMELTRQTTAIDFDINIEIAKHFNTPYVSVLNGQGKSLQQLEQEIDIEIQSVEEVDPFAIFVNRVQMDIAAQAPDHYQLPVFYLPENEILNTPTVKEVADALDGKMLTTKGRAWNRLVKTPIVAAMTPENYLPRVSEGDLVIVPGDRTDILLASIMSLFDRKIPNIAGIILTGGLKPAQVIQGLTLDFHGNHLPVVSVNTDTYETAMQASQVRAKLNAKNKQKTTIALGLFDQWVNRQCLIEKFQQDRDKETIMTPVMFEFCLFEKARQNLQTIVLPEAADERILRACEILYNRKVIHPILLGNADDIAYQCQLLGIHLEGVEIIDPEQSAWKQSFTEELYQLRKHKGMTLDTADDLISQVSYFATMMVYKGYADGMVSGATHTTAETIRPALQIIKSRPGISLISSLFFMCFETRVLVYADCAVNQNPDAGQLAEIAISSADTAQQFGIEPKVALLSYSTGQSGHGNEVEKVRQATHIAQTKRPDLLIEGPLQYDAAIDAKVARQKMPDCQVAGQATVFIFPDLNTGNNTYKAVQRASGAIAIGPVMQGLKKPVNDLSRGCTVSDIVNTVAITAIQAQQEQTSHSDNNGA